MKGQKRLDGREVSGLSLRVTGLEIDFIPEGLNPDDLHFETGDRLRVSMELVCKRDGTAEAFDSMGIGTKAPAASFEFRPLIEGFEVTGILRNVDRQASWDIEHGATG